MDYQAIWRHVLEWLSIFLELIKLRFTSSLKKDLEIIALRSQVSLINHNIKTGKCPKPRATPAFRQLWVLLSFVYGKWESILAHFKPGTVIRWRQTAFKLHWFKKSKKKGRPPISQKAINIINEMYNKNHNISPKKIHDQLVLLNITDAPVPNTIAKYLSLLKKPPSPDTKKQPSEKQIQAWLTFLRNHAPHTWGMDFFTVSTLFFKVLYVLVIINHGTRKIEHIAVTANPDAFWLVQQLRNATPYDHQPKYLVHDNDAVFTSNLFQGFLASAGIKSKRTAIKAPWQNPYAERVTGTLRRELLDYMIPINERHLEHLLGEYVHKELVPNAVEFE
jgi:putative transposase